MAVGPTESLSQSVLRMPPRQRLIAREANALINGMMQGALNARVSPNTAIPPAGASPLVHDAGLGVFIDLKA